MSYVSLFFPSFHFFGILAVVRCFNVSARHQVFPKVNTLCYHVQLVSRDDRLFLTKTASMFAYVQVCVCVWWYFFFGRSRAVAPWFIVNMYIPAEGTFRNLVIVQSPASCEAVRISVWLPQFFFILFGDCARFQKKESSIGDTSHKSTTQATSAEVALFAVDDCGIWQLLRRSSLQKWGTSRRVFEARVLLAVVCARRICQLKTSATCWLHRSFTNAAAVVSSTTGTMSCCLVTTLSLC